MKITHTITGDFFKGIYDSAPEIDKEKLCISYNTLSNLMIEPIVVLDFQKRNFHYMPKHDLCLCGYTHEESINMGYSFFKGAIHPNDLPFWIAVHDAVLNSFENGDLLASEVNYFSFLLQIINSLSTSKKTKYLLINVKLKPQWYMEQLRYGICMLSPSFMKKPDYKLCAYYNNRDHYDYSFKTKKWIHIKFSPLSRRQMEMLVLAQQGLSLKDTADKMNISVKTVDNMRHELFYKWEVSSIDQALQYASNHRLIYHWKK